MRPNRYFADQYEGNTAPVFATYANAGHVLYAHKATEGVYHVDQLHARRVDEAHDRDLTVMHYHFCRPDEGEPGAEALLFWRTVKPTWRDGDILALDFERLAPGMGPTEAAEYIETLWEKVRAVSGHTAVVYGSTSFLENNTRVRWLRIRRRWQAQYGQGPGRMPWGVGWWAWQYTDSVHGPEPHSLPGISNCDVSILNLRTATALSVRTRRRRRRLK